MSWFYRMVSALLQNITDPIEVEWIVELGCALSNSGRIVIEQTVGISEPSQAG